MLAGAHGIDLVLLVVAADDGVMPQTEEHLDILHLLGVRRGVVAITKIDLVDDARLAAVREEIEILLARHGARGRADRRGVGGHRRGHRRAARRDRTAVARPSSRPDAGRLLPPAGRPRLRHARPRRRRHRHRHRRARRAPVTPVRVLPGGDEARVRSVQVHGMRCDAPARRSASRSTSPASSDGVVGRGHVVCDRELDAITDRFDAWVELRPPAAPAAAEPPSSARLRRHRGGAWPARAGSTAARRWRRRSAPTRSSCCARRSSRFGGDRFILRDENAQRDDRRRHGRASVRHRASAPSTRACRRSSSASPSSDPAAIVLALLEMDACFARHADLARGGRRPAGGRGPVARCRSRGSPRYPAPGRWRRSRHESAGRNGSKLLLAALAVLPSRSSAAPRHGDGAAALAAPVSGRAAPLSCHRRSPRGATRRLVREESLVRLPTHRVSSRPRSAPRRGDRGSDRDRRLRRPTRSSSSETAQGRRSACSSTARRSNARASVARSRRTSSITLRRSRACANGSPSASAPAVSSRAAEFRDLIGASRKFSIALLDYFDRTGFTMRVGDVRKLRRG